MNGYAAFLTVMAICVILALASMEMSSKEKKDEPKAQDPYADAIIASLDNEPDEWGVDVFGGLRGPLSIEIENAVKYQRLGMKINRYNGLNSTPIHVEDTSGVEKAVERWVSRRAEIDGNRFLRDADLRAEELLIRKRQELAELEHREIQRQLRSDS